MPAKILLSPRLLSVLLFTTLLSSGIFVFPSYGEARPSSQQTSFAWNKIFFSTPFSTDGDPVLTVAQINALPEDPDVMMRLNGRALRIEDWQQAQQVDLTLALLLERPTKEEEQVFAEWIESELLWQMAQRHATHLPNNATATALQQWLQQHHCTLDQLDAALHDVGLRQESFEQFLLRQQTIQTFLHTIATIDPHIEQTLRALLKEQSHLQAGPAVSLIEKG